MLALIERESYNLHLSLSNSLFDFDTLDGKSWLRVQKFALFFLLTFVLRYVDFSDLKYGVAIMTIN